MKKVFIIINILMLSFMASAQKASIAVGCKPDKSGKLIVQIKFLFPDKVMSDYSVNLFRKAQGGSWEKITVTPFTKASVTESYTDEAYKTYKGYMARKQQANAEDENNAQAMAGLMIIDDNVFAKYAGCYYEDATAVAGNTYQYRITDAKNADKELAVSELFTVKENYLPKINSVTAKQKRQDINLDWKEGNAFYAYNVYRKSSADGKATLLTNEGIMLGGIEGDEKTKEEIKYTDSAVNMGTVYYVVTGIDVLGNESEQGEALKIEVKDMQAPETVKNVKAKRDDKNAIVTWDASKSSDVKGYNVYRNTSSDTVYKKITPTALPANTNTYTDKGLKDAAVYGYKIEVVDEAGNGIKSRPAKVFFADQTPPAKPTGLKAAIKPGSVQITWDKNKEADLKGYFIYRASNRNKDYFNMLYREPLTTNSFNDTLPGVAKNEFVYYIQAVDKSYNVSISSDTIIVTLPDTAAPHTPIIKNADYSNSAVTLDVVLNDDDAIGYNVYRCDDSLRSKNYKKITTVLATDKKYTDRINNKSQGYHYYIVAKDKAGNASSPSQKITVYADADKIITMQAQALTAKYNAADTAVTLSWSNNSKDVNGYIVYRKEGDGNFKPVSGVIKENRYVDRPVEQGLSFKYRVRTLFKETTETVNSDEVTVSTN